MYRTHFGLSKPLFDAGIAQDAAVYRNAKHDVLFANLKLAFAAPAAVATLSAPAGVGKTTLASAAVRASTTRLALAWINGIPTNATELLELLLTELGCNAHRTTRIERLQMWRQFLSEASATDSRVFVAVERTEDLSIEVLRALDSLTAADTNGSAGVNVLLLGQSELDRHLAAAPLDSLRQRIRLRLRLAPFAADDVERYLRLQVERAGGEFERLFAADAVAAVNRYSGGIARVVNNLCETALTLAANEALPQVTAEIVATAARDWLGLEDPAANETVAAPANAPAAAPTTSTVAAPPIATTTPIAAVQAATATVAPATNDELASNAAPAPVESDVPAAAAPVAPAEPIAATPVALPEAAEPIVLSASKSAGPLANEDVALEADEPTMTEIDFDGAGTDVPVVAAVDFPVLTDAVEPDEFAAAIAAEIEALDPPPARLAMPEPARAAEPPPRIETAYTSKRSTITPVAAQPAAPLVPTNAALTVTDESSGEDPLRQTQTMKAISTATSIDDISSSMAETLFGDADLDMLSKALASAGWSDAEAEAAPAPAHAAQAAKVAPTEPPPEDDLLDLLGLGGDAPLELLDDDAPPAEGESARRIAGRR